MTWLDRMRRRLGVFLRKRELEREMDEEMRFHLEMEAAELARTRGLSAEEARRQAHIAFGGVERYKEAGREARGVRPLEDLASDLRHGLRRLVREPGFSVPVVATLALGIGVTTAVFALVSAVLLRPLPYPESGRLVEVRHAAPRAEIVVEGLSPGAFLHYREHNRAFEEIGVYLEDHRALTDLGATEPVRLALVSPGLFAVLRAAPQLGRLPAETGGESDGSGGLVISHDLWVRRYGADPGIVGRTIEIDRRQEVVIGVAQPGFHFPHPETQVWATAEVEALLARFGDQANVRGLYLSGVGRLGPGVTPEEAERDLDRLVGTLPEAFSDVTAEQLEEMGLRGVIVPLKEAVVGDVRVSLLLLFATAVFLLLITCANATNLTLVRSGRQRREVAVQRALGATEGRLLRRFLSESLVVAALGGTLGLALAHIAVELRFGFDADQIPRLGEVGVDGVVVGFALSLSLLGAALLTGVSLLGARQAELAGALRGGHGRTTAGRREQTGRRILVAAQIALALLLLIGSTLMARSYGRLKQVELGFEPEGAITFFLPLPADPYAEYRLAARVHHEVLGRLRALPGVGAAEAATTSVFPLTPVPDYYINPVTAEGGAPTASTAATYVLVGSATPDYFQAMGIPLVQGRLFQSGDVRRASGVILSSSLARALFEGEDPIGRPVRLARADEPAFTVVGVVGDVPSRTIREGPSMALYLPNLYPAPEENATSSALHNQQYVVRTSLPPTTLLPAIRRSIHEVDPKLAMMRIGTLEDLVADSMARARLTMLLLLVGAATALCLGVIGIYGILAYMVRQRTPELGVRIALGASPTGVIRMVLRQGALLALGGIAVGLLTAFALTRFLGSLLYEVSPSDPVAFAGMSLLLLAVALAASYAPARRAGRIDPVRALKGE